MLVVTQHLARQLVFSLPLLGAMTSHGTSFVVEEASAPDDLPMGHKLVMKVPNFGEGFRKDLVEAAAYLGAK